MIFKPMNADLKTLTWTALAMTAFAANSVLCRLALTEGAADAASFTAVRLVSGALFLSAVTLRLGRPRKPFPGGDWHGAWMLFLYAAAFSLAYLQLTAATGALILFGAVQMTMILGGWRQGERPGGRGWAGMLLAFAGLVLLLLPGLSAPPLSAAVLMLLSGTAWGRYSLHGRTGEGPLAATAGHFTRACLPVAVLVVLFLPRLHLSPYGMLLALASGTLASGAGYVLWYAALRNLTATRAATVQLSVPVLAAAGGILFLSEPLNLRWILCAAAVLGGIALTLGDRQRGLQKIEL